MFLISRKRVLTEIPPYCGADLPGQVQAELRIILSVQELKLYRIWKRIVGVLMREKRSHLLNYIHQ